MKSLASCIKKAGKAINTADAEFLKESRQEYIQQGLSATEATSLAIMDYIEPINNEITDLTKEVRAKGGNAQETSFFGDDTGQATPTLFRSDEDPAYMDSPMLHNDIRDEFLDMFEQTAELDEIQAGMEDVSPSLQRLMKALIKDDLLGFDYMSQALEAALTSSDKDHVDFKAWELSQGTKTALANIAEKLPQEQRAYDVLYENELEAEKEIFGDTNGKRWDKWLVRTVQNKYLPLKDLQQRIIDAGGNILDNINPYVLETLMHGKAEERLRRLQKDYIAKITKLKVDSKLTQDEINLYLYALHAPSRNELIAERHENMDDDQIALFEEAGMTEDLFQDGGSGMTNQEAADILALAESEGKTESLQAIADVVHAMLDNKNDLLVKQGVLSVAQRESWDSMFDNYVPLKGEAVDENGDPKIEKLIIGKIGAGFSIRGKESFATLGRNSKAADILAVSIQDSTAAILRAEKNVVSQSFLNLVRDNPRPDYWQIYQYGRMPKTTYRDPETNKMVERDKTSGEMTNEDGYIAIKEGGKQYWVHIKSDPLLLKAMANLGPTDMGAVIKGMANATRFLSALNTSWNPEFLISNAMRDVQTAMFNVLGESDRAGGKLREDLNTPEKKKAFIKKMMSPKNLGNAFAGILTGYNKDGAELNNEKRDNDPEKENWAKHWRDFTEQGGKTGYFDMKEFEGQVKELEKFARMEEKDAKGYLMKGQAKFFGGIEQVNSAVENAVRLTTYVAAVTPVSEGGAGLTKQQAANLAKELTVNFNRKGEISWLNAVYMFGNASVQGTAQFMRSLGGKPWKHPSGTIKLTLAQKAAASLALAGYMFALIGRASAGEDEDGENYYDKIQNHELERNLVIMKSLFPWGKKDGSAYKIPLPYGYNIFFNAGTALDAMQNGPKRKDLGWAATFFGMSALGSFSPVGASYSDEGVLEGLSKTFAPTLVKPFWEMAIGENHFGSKLYRDKRYDVNPNMADAFGKQSTPEHWKKVAIFMNELNGTVNRPGTLDFAPESFEHLYKSWSGGLGRLVDNSVDTLTKVFEGNTDEIEVRNIPLIRKLNSEISPYVNTNVYYERKAEIIGFVEDADLLKGAEKREFKREHKDILRLNTKMEATEKKLRDLRKRMNRVKIRIEKNKTPEDVLKLKVYEKRKVRIINAFNKKYNDIFNQD